MKPCKKCQQSKPLNEFVRSRNYADGYTNKCKVCSNKYVTEWYLRNPDKAKFKQQTTNRQSTGNRHQLSETINYRARQLFCAARTRAKNTNRSFTITIEHIEHMLELGVCAGSGIPLDMSLNRKRTFRNPFSPSLDRRNSRKGYDPDNVQIVCSMFNMGKSDYNELDYIAQCVAVAKRHAGNPAVAIRLLELSA